MAAKGCLVLLAFACLFSASHSAETDGPKIVDSRTAGITAEMIDGAKPSADNAGIFEIEHEGVTYLVADSAEHKRPYFINKETKASQWTDPRIPESTGSDNNININVDSSVLDRKLRKGKRSTATLLAVVLVPIFIFAGLMAGRIYYLQTYFPDLLWPTKERKYRQRQNSKFKPQKARGKMSQDGKGGRSANS